MPNYFRFTRKSDGTLPTLGEVDEAVCKRLGVECDPVKYYAGWYDSIGELIALGYDAEKMRNVYKEVESGSPEMLAVALAIIDALDAEFTWSAWYQPKM